MSLQPANDAPTIKIPMTPLDIGLDTDRTSQVFRAAVVSDPNKTDTITLEIGLPGGTIVLDSARLGKKDLLPPTTPQQHFLKLVSGIAAVFNEPAKWGVALPEGLKLTRAPGSPIFEVRTNTGNIEYLQDEKVKFE